MKWSHKTPAIAGVYWHLDVGDVAICEVVLDESTGGLLVLLTGDDQLYDAADFTGLWFGPIAPPRLPPAAPLGSQESPRGIHLRSRA